VVVLDFAIMVFDAASGAARLHRSHALLDDLLHASQCVLNLRTIRHVPGRELVPAQPTGQISPELELAQPHLEQLPAVRAGQIDACAPMILEQAVVSG
jgi:hypothetical protein